jgi:prepilin-type N-terminal cleavage/methylation domain-containing protein
MKRKAFTLIELAIVVAILGVLTAIAVPAYANARVRTTEAACDKSRQAFQQAKMLWMVDNGKVFSDEVYFRDLLPEYIESPPLCPLKGTYSLNGQQGETTCSAHSR